MKKRRAISEVVAAVLLVAVIATASFLAVSTSSRQTMENEKTVADALHEKTMQIQELIGVISYKTQSNKVILEVINYGMKEITLDKVLVDGRESEFVLRDDNDAFANNTIPQKRILVLETNTVGNSIQLITDSGNFINIELS